MAARQRRDTRHQTVLHVVEELADKPKNDFMLKVNREQLFESVVKYLNQRTAEFNKLSVMFVTEGYVEEGVDSGGICNEMFTLFFEECLCPYRKMFEGEGHVWLPTDDKTALDNKWFYCLGKAIVLSLVSGGAGFPYLGVSCLAYLQNEQLRDVGRGNRVDMTQKLLCMIDQINNCKTEGQLSVLVKESEIQKLKEDVNWQRDIQMKERTTFTDKISEWFLLGKRKPALDQLREGLGCLGFLDKALQCSDVHRFFVYDESFSVNSRYIVNQLLPKLFNIKTNDSNEQEVIETAANCLSELKDEGAVNLFQFITGMRSLPARPIDIRVVFNMQNTSNKLPRASTCVPLLLLPLGNKNPKEFIQSFSTAIENRHGFGRI